MSQLPRSKEYREEQYLRITSKIRSLVDSSIESPEYGGGVHPIDHLEGFVMSSGMFSHMRAYSDFVKEVEYYKEENERLLKCSKRGY